MTPIERDTPGEITGLLIAWRGGDRASFDRLFPILYDELRALARGPIRRAGGDRAIVLSLEITPERWRALSALLDEALDRPSERRAGFLAEVEARDPATRVLLEDLLRASETPDGILDRPRPPPPPRRSSPASPRTTSPRPAPKEGWRGRALAPGPSGARSAAAAWASCTSRSGPTAGSSNASP